MHVFAPRGLPLGGLFNQRCVDIASSITGGLLYCLMEGTIQIFRKGDKVYKKTDFCFFWVLKIVPMGTSELFDLFDYIFRS